MYPHLLMKKQADPRKRKEEEEKKKEKLWLEIGNTPSSSSTLVREKVKNHFALDFFTFSNFLSHCLILETWPLPVGMGQIVDFLDGWNLKNIGWICPSSTEQSRNTTP